jgi:hypothetical protein
MRHENREEFFIAKRASERKSIKQTKMKKLKSNWGGDGGVSDGSSIAFCLKQAGRQAGRKKGEEEGSTRHTMTTRYIYIRRKRVI